MYPIGCYLYLIIPIWLYLYQSTGNVTFTMDENDVSSIKMADIEASLPTFRGDIMQVGNET